MKTIRTILIAMSITASVQMSLVAAPGQEEEHEKGKEMTMTGCLTKGTDVPQHFSFVDKKSGRKWTVTGTPDLEKHAANHTVRITGTATAHVFKVTKVEHVSDTCQAKDEALDK
jgi:hypothetical protein